MGAHFRLAVAEHPRTLRLEIVPRSANIFDFVADVVDAAVGIALEEFRYRGRMPERLDELDLGVGQGDENGRDPVLRLRLRLGYLCAQGAAIDVRSFGDVAHRDRYMIEPSDHGHLLRPFHCPSTPDAGRQASRTRVRSHASILFSRIMDRRIRSEERRVGKECRSWWSA